MIKYKDGDTKTNYEQSSNLNTKKSHYKQYKHIGGTETTYRKKKKRVRNTATALKELQGYNVIVLQ